MWTDGIISIAITVHILLLNRILDVLFCIDNLWRVNDKNAAKKENSRKNCGIEVISDINTDNFGVKPLYLILVCLFSNIICGLMV